MAAEYPGTIPTIANNKADATTMASDHPAHHNKLADEVVAIATELGTDPAGAETDVVTRLGKMPRFLELTSDATTVVGTAYADAASGLNIAVTNGTPVRFQYMIFWLANATTTGARFSLNGPSFTRFVYHIRWNTTATTMTVSTGQTTAYDNNHTVGTASDATNNVAIIEGLLLPSASGTLALRAGAEIASPGSVTVKSGSSVLYW